MMHAMNSTFSVDSDDPSESWAIGFVQQVLYQLNCVPSPLDILFLHIRVTRDRE